MEINFTEHRRGFILGREPFLELCFRLGLCFCSQEQRVGPSDFIN